MKIITGIIVGIVALVGIGGAAIATGIVRAPFSAPQTNIQAAPPLQLLLAQTPNNADMSVTLSERFLNKQIIKGIPNTGEISNAQLDLHAGDLADVTATVQVNRLLTVQPKISVKLAVQNGRIVIEVQRVDVGGIGIPDSLIQAQVAQLKQTAEEELNKQFAELEKSTGLKLHSLSTTENSLTLYFAP